MSPLSQLTPEAALLAGRAVFLIFCFVLAAVTFTRWRRATDESTQLFFMQNRSLLERLQSLERELATTRDQLSGARAEIAQISGKLEEGEQRRTPTPAPTAAPSYQIAIRLARSGAPREELMATCGLSRQEAELVQRLHAPKRSPRLAATG